jgi:phosphate transport system permease protein
MIRLIPASLREASYALGVPKWKTVLRIVFPTASTGITNRGHAGGRSRHR